MTKTKTQIQTQIECLERVSQNRISSASSTLRHYFALSTSDLDSDNFAEIDGFVECIVEAAVAQAKAEILKELRATDPLPSCEFDPN